MQEKARRVVRKAVKCRKEISDLKVKESEKMLDTRS